MASTFQNGSDSYSLDDYCFNRMKIGFDAYSFSTKKKPKSRPVVSHLQLLYRLHLHLLILTKQLYEKYYQLCYFICISHNAQQSCILVIRITTRLYHNWSGTPNDANDFIENQRTYHTTDRVNNGIDTKSKLQLGNYKSKSEKRTYLPRTTCFFRTLKWFNSSNIQQHFRHCFELQQYRVLKFWTRVCFNVVQLAYRDQTVHNIKTACKNHFKRDAQKIYTGLSYLRNAIRFVLFVGLFGIFSKFVWRLRGYEINSSFASEVSFKHGMDRQCAQKSVDSHQYNRDGDENKGSSTSYPNPAARHSSLSPSHANRESTSSENENIAYISDNQPQLYRFAYSSLTRSSSQNSPVMKTRISSVDRCRSQSPRKTQAKLIDDPSGNSNCMEYPYAYYSSNRINSRNSPKERFSHDKENESPQLMEAISSPKMKISEHALAEQNSPLFSDSTKVRFTFSPRQMYSDDAAIIGSTLQTSHSFTDQFGSPLLSTAVYKHGNYFKFPEVDTLTPDPISNDVPSTATKTTTTIGTEVVTQPACQKLTTPKSQTSRRVRLKSISLDSEGARLVEDNLGKPVEELIEYTNQSSSSSSSKDSQTIVNQTETEVQQEMQNEEDKGISDSDLASTVQVPVEANNTIQIVVPPPSISTVQKTSRKNKNNLKITIDNSTGSSSRHGSHDPVPLVKVQTPKTPTLTQTKQKAFSLDSSDTNNFTCSCPTSIRKYNAQQRSASNSKSVNHPSSISVPTTPKRHAYTNKKKTYGKSMANAKHTVSTKSSLHQPPMTSVISTSFESRGHPCYNINSDDRSMRIAIDIDDNYGECTEEIDDDQIENFYMGEIEDSVVLAADASKVPPANENESRKWGKTSGDAEVDVTSKSCDYFLLGTNLQTQKYGMLSLSNNNLETLPEVMTLTDFTSAGRDEVTKVPVTKAQHDSSDETRSTTAAKTTTTSTRNNLLQRRGSNHSLTINLNGSLGNLSKCMSVSNYSLGNYTGSNFNLNSCPQHHLGMFHQVPSNTSSTQSIVAHAYGSSQTNIMFANSTSPIQQQPSFEADVVTTDGNTNKKNILQRRGSNTSLTLNIKGSNHANLSRFSSHSSLNIASAHPNFGFSPAPGKVKQPQPTPSPQPQCNPYHPQQAFRQQHSASRRGLLERRNSNASLTLNIQNVGFNGSSYNLRASACSLNNITNTSVECFDSTCAQTDHANPINLTSELASVDGLQQQRKFLSSENLNTMMSRCNKLNQTHVRNSTKTCFGSVSDLKPNALTDFNTKSNQNDEVPTDATLRHFQQLNLCSCTGVRNITTKPLSPQSTSEDFKMYLANIQLLQNATNVLNEEHLRKLHFVFTQNYETRQASYGGGGSNWKMDTRSISGGLTFDETERRHWTQKSYTADGLSRFHFNAFPDDDEKKNLLRSLHEEFWDLPTNHQEKPLVFGSQSKNRYKTILPNEHSRVLLELEPENLQEPYINANYIKGPDYAKNSYIVTQGPLPNTIYDYWLMVQQNIAKSQRKVSHDPGRPDDYQQQGFKIEYQIDQLSEAVRNPRTSKCHTQKMVMLTNFFEHNQQKCSNYFPIEIDDVLIVTNSNNKFESRRLAKFYEKHFNDGRNNGTGSRYESEIEIEISRIPNKSIPIDEIPSANYFLIKNCGLHKKDGYSIRKFNCLYVVARPNPPGQERNEPLKQTLRRFTCYHYWFPDWPDHHSPGNIGFLLDMTLHLLDVCCEKEFRQYEVNREVDCKCRGYENTQSKCKNASVLESVLAMPGDIEPIPIIHCSAGIGRTGCLVAILNGVRQIRSSMLLALKPWNFKLTRQSIAVMKNNKNYVNVDVLGIVCNLRLQRGGMVQNSEQYELIHRVLCLYQTRIDAELFQLDQKWNDQILPQRHEDLEDESSII